MRLTSFRWLDQRRLRDRGASGQDALFRALNKRIRLFQLNWDDRIYAHDLTRPFPWNGESVDAVYSSHTLEHLTREQGRAFLRECYRVLRKGGVIRIIVPDLQPLVEDYQRGKVQADEFVERLGVLYGTGGGGLRSRLAHLIHFPHQ
ncbi:MAG: methyltransferase domain-containing protein [Nitrospira sp.]|nr:MAG: methyltransferase domain-containing protein [Nitrospira sp.]